MKLVVCMQLIMILQIGCGNETQEHAQPFNHQPTERNQNADAQLESKYLAEINKIHQKAKQLKEELEAIEQRQSQVHLKTKDPRTLKEKRVYQESRTAQKQVSIADFEMQNKNTVRRLEKLEGEICSIKTRYSMVSYLLRKTDRIENCYSDVCKDVDLLFEKAEKFELGILKLIELIEDDHRKNDDFISNNNRKIKKLKNKILLLTESKFTQEDACSESCDDDGLIDDSN